MGQLTDAPGKPEFPADHMFAMEVPKGGSSCAKCAFGSSDGTHCGNEHFQAWRVAMGHEEDPGKLPVPADEYCCDVFQAKGAKTARVHLAVIREEKGQYCVRSPNNPDWNGGCYDTKGEAEERLQEVEFFKSKSATSFIHRVVYRWIIGQR